MKISARNVFDGIVAAIKPGPVHSEADIDLPGGLRIVATVTHDSVAELGLAAGRPAKAIVKASSVLVLADGAGVKLSARNRLEGTVSAIVQGPVSSSVTIALPQGASMCATVTHESLLALGLKVGAPATAVFKAPSVIVGVDA